MNVSRRAFLARTAAWASSSVLAHAVETADARRPQRDTDLSIALVGCGYRGTDAALQALSYDPSIRVVALADVFPDQLEATLASLQQRSPAQVSVPAARRFVGLDAYRRAIDVGPDVVILATPPGFRPVQFEYAVDHGCHAFLEKPVAVDAPGVRRVMQSSSEAQRGNVKIGVGLQRRHSRRYQETVERIHEGAIGPVHLVRCYNNVGGVWRRPRSELQTETEYQLRNWYYFTWLSGDFIVEQHVDNLDIANWVLRGHPIEAQGQGGRQVREGPEHGQIYDHHMVEFTYADGTTLLSQCRQIPNAWGQVNELVTGRDGRADLGEARIESRRMEDDRLGGPWQSGASELDPYQAEMDAFLDAVGNDMPYNEGHRGAESTLTAILGRMATYSGKVVRWDEALASERALAPRLDRLTLSGRAPVRRRSDGGYYVPVPGQFRAR